MTEASPSELRHALEREESGEVAVTVAILEGEMDLVSVRDFDEAIEAALATAPDALVVDMSGVRFVDSAGVNALARVREGREIPVAVVVPPGSAVDRILAVGGLREIVRPLPERSEAVESVVSAPSHGAGEDA